MKVVDIKRFFQKCNPYDLVYFDYFGKLVALDTLFYDLDNSRLVLQGETHTFGYDMRVRHLLPCLDNCCNDKYIAFVQIKNQVFQIQDVFADFASKMVIILLSLD
jgi:hypothetical protein